ncbi:MAG: Lrp/AsnC family transcriptional regulator [Candidatus Kapabacteria bacterium]|nr:Lrp/AsnC family transcriptional regulator [Candidatus Kapabacteria bacterium]MBX7154645.1 Lrp/AsnC family transcriptional regulator [Bacteroidota bacterium]
MASVSEKLKDTDKIICKMLESNAKTSLSEIAEKVGLSVPSVSEHIKKLEEQGIIEGYFAKINHEYLNLDITAFISVRVDSSSNYAGFIAQCKKSPEVLECHAITGDASHLLKIRVENTSALEKLLSRIQQWKGVQRTMTNLVLSTHIESFAVVS